jgi:thioredoxin-related protein
MITLTRRALPALLASLALGGEGRAGAFASASRGPELLMFERQGCAWCIRWEREIAPVYGLTDEGKQAPLRRINVDNGAPSHAEVGSVLKTQVLFTPTFVLVNKGREIGRITGYMNPEQFWGLLGTLVAAMREAS